MPDNSLRKTRRCRSINVNGPEIERRKSRRHSCCKHMVFLCVMFESALNPSISKVVYKLERKENQLAQYRIFPVIHIRFFCVATIGLSSNMNASLDASNGYKSRSSSALHQHMDEDSSSSANSSELNEVFNVGGRGSHGNAGVTPGLRRRRERAERQISFLREQQEAAANGLRPFDIKNDIISEQGTDSVTMPFLYQRLQHIFAF